MLRRLLKRRATPLDAKATAHPRQPNPRWPLALNCHLRRDIGLDCD